jgi:hypothetical protein
MDRIRFWIPLFTLMFALAPLSRGQAAPPAKQPTFEQSFAYGIGGGQYVFIWQVQDRPYVTTAANELKYYELQVSESADDKGKPKTPFVFDKKFEQLPLAVPNDLARHYGPDTLVIRSQTIATTTFEAVYTTAQKALGPNRPYYWQVIAFYKDGTQAISQGSKSKTLDSTSVSPVNYFKGLTFQRSYIDKMVSEPPSFSFSEPQQSSTTSTYTLDAALVYNADLTLPNPNADPKNPFTDSFGLVGAVDAHVSSDSSSSASEHSLAGEAGLSWLRDWTPNNPSLDNSFESYMTLTGTYESSQSGETQKALAVYRFTPIYWPPGAELGTILYHDQLADKDNYDNAYITFVHEETLGFDGGGTTKGTTTGVENQTGVFRLVGEFHPKLTFNTSSIFATATGIGSEIGDRIKSIDIYADDIVRYLAPEARGVNFLSTGIDVNFNEDFGVTFYYKIGRDAPVFQKVESFNFGLTGSF